VNVHEYNISEILLAFGIVDLSLGDTGVGSLPFFGIFGTEREHFS
jgi:hypothetical protein